MQGYRTIQTPTILNLKKKFQEAISQKVMYI